MIEKLDIMLSKLVNRKTLRILRRGLLSMMPMVLVGSVVMALLTLPIPPYHRFMSGMFGEGWREIGLSIHKATLQIMALLALITVSHAAAKEETLVKSGEVNPVSIMITVFASYIALSYRSLFMYTSDAGSAGLFKALFVSVAACHLFCFFYKHCCRILPLNGITHLGGSLTQASFLAVMPAFLTVLVFSGLRVLLVSSCISTYPGMLLQRINGTWMTGTNFISAALILLLTHILAFFGVCSEPMITDAVSGVTPAFSTVVGPSIFNKGFFDTYVYLGGIGATLGLLSALLLAGENNRIVKISIPLGVFNINDTMLYGFPVIFNSYYFIPFILAPVFLGLNAYLAMILGWVPPIAQEIEWTIPIFLSGFLASGSFSGVLLQALNLVISMLIYLPFVRLQVKHQQRDRLITFQALSKELQNIQEKKREKIISRHDDIGLLARALLAEIRSGLNGHKKSLYLEYQPKVNYRGEVMGCEALLRWTHPVYGYISPLMVLRICDEAGLNNQLGTWVIRQALPALRCWKRQGYDGLSLSINLNPQQLREDNTLIGTVQRLISLYGLEPGCVEFELTENAAVDCSDSTRDRLRQIREMGVNISIDDFGMGHSSLLYLCDFHANIVKIDASLVTRIASDRRRQQIVETILSLCRQMAVQVIAEGVETEEQVQMLHELDCDYYQGFYFSRSLSCDKFIEYVNQHGIEVDKKMETAIPHTDLSRKFICAACCSAACYEPHAKFADEKKS